MMATLKDNVGGTGRWTWRRVRSRLVLAAQRHSGWVPGPVRHILARHLTGSGGSTTVSPVEDWSAPLLGPGAERTPFRWPPEGAALRLTGGATPPVEPGSEHPLRCLLVTDTLDAGGLDEMVAFLARRLPETGFQVAVLLAPVDDSKRMGRLGRELAGQGIDVIEGDPTSGAAWMRRWRPDVLSVHGAAEWALDAGRSCGVPAVETLHGLHNQFNTPTADIVARRIKLAGLVSVSEMVRRQYAQLDPECDSGDMVTIPNGVDPGRQRLVSRDEARECLGVTDEFLLVSLSRHCLQKNTYGLARAFSDVARAAADAHLLICGRPDDSTYAAQVARLKQDMPHGERLHLRDHSPRPGVLLSAADGFVLDSFFEGWALASMEALAAGIPIVVSDVGGAREQLEDSPHSGLLVANPLGDPVDVDWERIGAARFRHQANREELVEAMLRLKTWPHDRDSRRRLAGESLLRFSDDRCLRSHADVLAAAAAGRPIGPAHDRAEYR